MPWMFNSTRNVIPVKLQDGSSYGFLPRQRVYIVPHNMSAEIWQLVRDSRLISHGGDPELLNVVAASNDIAAPAQANDTSSSHHVPDGRVTVESDVASELAVSRQADDFMKSASEDSDVSIQRNGNSKKHRKR